MRLKFSFHFTDVKKNNPYCRVKTKLFYSSSFSRNASYVQPIEYIQTHSTMYNLFTKVYQPRSINLHCYYFRVRQAATSAWSVIEDPLPIGVSTNSVTWILVCYRTKNDGHMKIAALTVSWIEASSRPSNISQIDIRVRTVQSHR